MNKTTPVVNNGITVNHMINTNKTEYQESLETVVAIQAIKFGMVEYGTVIYWHYMSLINNNGS